ncbi:hypothetical protein AMS68_005810 [Peltaster fructicola]|uniref:F-box domain-containing protein n=1 Tax=Peltaster fructicola TaxID=286661 RepID=A0A6H0XZV2_9PEZI|nr:hypothetical protein AMS68_005810 [Peltaster fructicola]
MPVVLSNAATEFTTSKELHRPTRPPGKDVVKKVDSIDDEEPLVDTTVILPLHSKKLDRLNKKQAKKSVKLAEKQALASVLRLPAELLLQVLGALQPRDVLVVRQVNVALNEFIKEHEYVIAKDIISQRYWTLHRCFPLPILLAKVDPAAHFALLNPRRQKLMALHKKAYQHIPAIDQEKLCTCTTCIYAWNHLCLILDLAHWQKNLNSRQPIPMIARHETSEWNQELMSHHATIIDRAVTKHLTYAVLLQMHLETIVGTILRRIKQAGKAGAVEERLYQMSDAEAVCGNDTFLEKNGPPSYEFPYHRDNYYGLEVYLPNRKWSKEKKQWLYYLFHGRQHEQDVGWAVLHFSS